MRIPVAALFLLALALSSQAPAQRFDHGVLWRVEGGASAPSHVFGTVHVDDPRVTELSPAVSRVLEESRSLTVELSLDPGNMLALAGRMLLQDGRDLAGIAGAELYGKVAAQAAKLGLPEPALRMLKPWAVALLIMTPPQNPENVLDYVLVRRAAAQKIPVHELETVTEQVDVFEGMTEADQVALLRYAVDNQERLPQLTGSLVDAYLARDLAGMWRISRENGDDAETRRLHEVFVERVLFARNTRMAGRMEARLKEGAALIAVGALHLYGDRGVLAELQRRGYRVTAVY
ncbi:MAG TPA: TraB/GumN family protein [Burkholderiales bacterium]|nr:TraB/GumN family protein [Burkholderiales bacterium]